MDLTLENFFGTVLPENGIYAVAYRPTGKQFVSHSIHDNLVSLIDKAQSHAYEPVDYWFALANFNQGFYKEINHHGKEVTKFRTQKNAKNLRCLFLDVDAGDDKPYKTTADALIALRSFCLETRLPIPTIVYSGSGGIHCYWPFTQSVDKDMWRVLASKLHAATVKHNFQVDPMRTRDCASILRIPQTLNWKHAMPTSVVLKYLATPVEYDYYLGLLNEYQADEVQPSNSQDELLQAFLKMDFPKIEIPEVASINVEAVDVSVIYDKRKAEEVVAQCLQLQDQKNAPEPVWRGMLATLRHCEGGIELAHKLSKQDPRYTEQDTDEKLAQLEAKDIAPYTCVTFTNLRPEVCHKCPHQGKINSPISVPVSKITVVEIDDSTGEVEKSIINAIDTPTANIVNSIPEYSTANYIVNETGCSVLIPTKNGGSFWHRFYDFPVYPIQKIKDRLPNGDIQVSYIFRKHHPKGHDDFQINGETLMGTGINGFLGSVGFLLPQEDRKYMSAFMIDILRNIDNELPETKMMNRLGWDDNMESFLLGNKIYRTDGKVIDVTPKGTAAEYSNQTESRGSLEQWKRIASVYNKKGLEWGQVAVASAFASPLMPIGSLERAALLFITGEKGVGKSTALSLAVSVFGNPTRMMINKDDTYLARLAKLGIMNNISVGFDEMTDLTPKEASELAYQITQGRGKDRMAQGGEGIQHNTTYWSCLPVMSANDSIINALAQHSFDASAQMSRVLEIKATDINDVYTREEFIEHERAVRSMPHNYGTAGAEYMKWVTANKSTVEDIIYKTERLFIERTGLTSNYRFWTYMCTRMLSGIIIARKLGLVEYDVEGMFQYLVDLVKDSLRRINRQNNDTTSLLGSFLNEHIGNRIVVKSDERPADKPFMPELGSSNDIGYVLQHLASGRDLQVRVIQDDHTCYISLKAIKAWCHRMGVPYDSFMTGMYKTTHVIKDKTKIMLGKNTQYANTARSDCIYITLPKDADVPTTPIAT